MRSVDEGYDHICLIAFATNRSSVLAVQRHVKDANTELCSHISLKLQAFDHPRLNTAVVVANRQCASRALGAKKDFPRMGHCCSRLQQVSDASLLVL